MVERSLTIAAVVAATGVSAETLRFYEREGLIDRLGRPAPGHGKYPTSVIGRIRFIRRALDLGFTLREIRELIALGAAPAADSVETTRIAQGEIEPIETKVAEFSRMRALLDGRKQS